MVNRGQRNTYPPTHEYYTYTYYSPVAGPVKARSTVAGSSIEPPYPAAGALT